MSVQQLINDIRSKNSEECLYHYTDETSTDSIFEHGILSSYELSRREIEPIHSGGNIISRRADRKKGITDYVFLCIAPDHPFAHVSIEKGDLPNPVYLRIMPEVILNEGVIYADGVANANKTELIPIAEASKLIDLTLIYTKVNWNVGPRWSRPKNAKKKEILIPKCVSTEFIMGDD